MKIEVSNGEIVDKITILQIKSERIQDEDKLINVNKELNYLLPILKDIGIDTQHELFIELLNINKELWEIEDDIRLKEKYADFGNKFIEVARSVYITNDKRSIVKKEINNLTGSDFTEEKSYK